MNTDGCITLRLFTNFLNEGHGGATRLAKHPMHKMLCVAQTYVVFIQSSKNGMFEGSGPTHIPLYKSLMYVQRLSVCVYVCCFVLLVYKDVLLVDVDDVAYCFYMSVI